MGTRNINLVILFILALLTSQGCKQDSSKEEVSVENLFGKWEIYHATRNRAETKSLEGGYFNFISDTEVESNIFGTEEIYPFEFHKKSILIESPTALNMDISLLRNDTLKVTSKIQVFNMEFHLKRNLNNNK